MGESFTDDKNGKLIGSQKTVYDIDEVKKSSLWVLVDRVQSRMTRAIYAIYKNTKTGEILEFDESRNLFVLLARNGVWIYNSEGIDKVVRQMCGGS